MFGAIVGDIVGSVHEWAGTKKKDFPLFVRGSTFTDDSVLTKRPSFPDDPRPRP